VCVLVEGGVDAGIDIGGGSKEAGVVNVVCVRIDVLAWLGGGAATNSSSAISSSAPVSSTTSSSTLSSCLKIQRCIPAEYTGGKW